MGVSNHNLIFFFCFILYSCVIPKLVIAGITRHYNFEVNIYIFKYYFFEVHCFGQFNDIEINICNVFDVFQIKMQNVTRLCHTKSMVTVNGKFPGPRIVAREGDRLLIKVVNHVPNNISIHWYNFISIYIDAYLTFY